MRLASLDYPVMPFRWSPAEHLSLFRYFLKWVLIASPAGALVGAATALFLWALDRVTETRWNHPWLLFLLPIAGILTGAMYHFFGKSAEGGNNLIVEQIHEPGGGVPKRMAPLVLVGTLITHLCGGSAGREGTAVQMGGSIAHAVGRFLRLGPSDIRTLLMVGIAAGFGAVFGTPLTGAIFAIEVLALGRMSYEALLPCLIGSIVGDYATTALHIHHTTYHVAIFASSTTPFSWLLLGKVVAAAIGFGLASVLFAEMAHSFTKIYKWIVPSPIFRPALGAVVVISLVYLVGTRDYLGLGVIADPHTPGGVSILSSFLPGGATHWSWLWKIIFTAVTVSAGFKGGEVTPLFFIGAALGNTIAWLFHAPVDLFAALGFVAVFAGATNTPLACTIMAIELFGHENGLIGKGFVIYSATACFIAYLFSGHSGIYLSQRIGTPKVKDVRMPHGASLRTLRERLPSWMDWR